MTLLAGSISPMLHRKTTPALLGIGTAHPPAATQASLLQVAHTLAAFSESEHKWLQRVFLRSDIRARGSVLVRHPENALAEFQQFYPPVRFEGDSGPTTAERMARYAVDAPPLAERAARSALDDAGLESEQITHVIPASCTGFFAPGLDAELIQRLNLRRDVQRVQVGFMGCHAAFNALGAASQIVTANAKARVLVCCVELCSLHLAYGKDPGKMIANALFADGAAAMVLGASTQSDESPWQLRAFSSFLVPDTSDAMSWTIGDHGFEMTLSAGVPAMIRQNLRGWAERFLAENRLTLDQITHWAIHPGGPKILAAVAESLNLSAEQMQPSREVLAEHGNMSSATVPYILERFSNQSGTCMAIGLGPGLMIEGMLLHK